MDKLVTTMKDLMTGFAVRLRIERNGIRLEKLR